LGQTWLHGPTEEAIISRRLRLVAAERKAIQSLRLRLRDAFGRAEVVNGAAEAARLKTVP